MQNSDKLINTDWFCYNNQLIPMYLNKLDEEIGMII